MTYEEFLEELKGYKYSVLTQKEFKDKLGSINKYSRRRDENKDLDNTKPYALYNEECIGGTRGGSCWDDGTEDRHYGYTNSEGAIDCKRRFDEMFDAIVEKIYPDISYLKYKSLSSIIKNTERTEYEYYGNSSDYLIMYVEVEEFYNKLKELL